MQNADVRKVQFGGIERIGVPYRVHALKAVFNPTVRVPLSRYPYSRVQKNEFHFPANRALQSRLLAELVREEGPVHFDYAVQRLAEAWGVKRAGPKVNHAAKEALDLLHQSHRIIVKGSFLWPLELVDAPARVPVPDIPESIREIDRIPPEEIEDAMKLTAQYALGISEESLIVETAKVFGFNHAGEKIRQAIHEIYRKMLRERKLVCTNNIVATT